MMWTIVVVVGLVGVLLVGAELYARRHVARRLADQLGTLAGYPVAVSLSRRPLVLQYYGSVPHLDVAGVGADGVPSAIRAEDLRLGEDVTIGRLQGCAVVDGITVDGEVRELTLRAGRLVLIGDIAATAHLPFERLLAEAAGQVQSISGNAAQGTVKIRTSATMMLVSVPVSITVTPVPVDGRIRLEVVRADVAGTLYLPPDFVQLFLNRVTAAASALIDEVNVTEITVTDRGLAVAFTGSRVRVERLAAADGQGRWRLGRMAA
ncbi:MAG: LmeA family phospholipid-binding protein [Gordonia sp. (in: high G+C Gram-positive bacteria)]